jgi:hypothetical protein
MGYMKLPHNGGRVRDAGSGFPFQYPNGKSSWRCSWCGKVGPWREGWGGHWSALEEDDGLMSDHDNGLPVWCCPACQGQVVAAGACAPTRAPDVTRKRR